MEPSSLKISELNQTKYIPIFESPAVGILLRKMRLSDVVTGLRSRNGLSLKSSTCVLYQGPDLQQSASRINELHWVRSEKSWYFLCFATMPEK